MPPAAPFHRILLINPPSGLYRRDDRCQSRVEDQTVRIVFPPIDLAVLAAIARQAGAEAKIGDYPAAGTDWRQYQADLADFRPDCVLFNVTTATILSDLQAAVLAKEENRNILTIARGETFERGGEDFFDHAPALDLALYGDVEDNFERLVRGEETATLSGLLYREETTGRTRRNPGRPVAADLDAFPLPARDLLDNSLYRSPETGNPLTVIVANRGCPSHCIFCPAGSMSDYRLRLRSADSIVAELQECAFRFGIREFLFHGDTFTMNKRWLLELCEKIIAAKLPIRWGCNSRVDTMDLERAQALRRAGCWVVAFGVESGDQEMLDRMKKGTRLEQAERAIAACKQAGLATHAFYIIGLPWETRESLARTFAFVRKLNTDFFDFNIAYPLPGTELYEIAQAEGLTTPDLMAHGSYAHAGLRTHTLTAEDLTRWRRMALLRLYARPTYIARTLVRAWRTRTLRHYVKAAVARLKGLIVR